MNCILHYNFKEDQIWSISSFNQEKLHELIIPLHHSIQQRERDKWGTKKYKNQFCKYKIWIKWRMAAIQVFHPQTLE